ncbi:MAG: hypothetical protein U0326_00890 [Polyangiales bacterium]
MPGMHAQPSSTRPLQLLSMPSSQTSRSPHEVLASGAAPASGYGITEPSGSITAPSGSTVDPSGSATVASGALTLPSGVLVGTSG